jgi:hypothetical protein
LGKKGSEYISDYWRRRWLAPRLAYDFAIAQVRSHSTDFIVTHGTRVGLPFVDGDQGSLFEEFEDEEEYSAHSWQRPLALIAGKLQVMALRRRIS